MGMPPTSCARSDRRSGKTGKLIIKIRMRLKPNKSLTSKINDLFGLKFLSDINNLIKILVVNLYSYPGFCFRFLLSSNVLSGIGKTVV
jgi:hypothetical protein